MSRLVLVLAAFVVVSSFSLSALIAPAEARTLPVGVVDDAMKWTDTPGVHASKARSLGVGTFRMTLPWKRGKTALTIADKNAFDRIARLNPRPKVVLTVYGPPLQTPQTLTQRRQYCLFVSTALKRWPWIKTVVVWNEVNKAYFWAPQFSSSGRALAPAAYGRLLSTCWDILKLRHKGLSLATNLSPRRGGRRDAAPLYFIADLGKWYKASGRKKPIFDVWGQNVYGPTSKERVSVRHYGGSVGIGDYGRLMTTLRNAFSGTRQPLPSATRRKLWYLEAGYQTAVPADKASFYTGVENVPVLPPTGTLSQASQLRAAIKTAYCQPAVGFFFNFLLQDETRLEGWQSGLVYADGVKKASWTPVRAQILAARAGTLRC